MSQWAEVRHLHLVEGVPKKEIARRLKLDVKTVRRAIGRPTPPVRVSPQRVRSLDPWRKQIEEWLHDDPRLTAKRVRRLLLPLAGPVSQRTVRRYVAALKSEVKTKEAFVHRSALPGATMEVDFGETWVDLAGAPCKVKYLVATLPYSNAYFAKAYPIERLASLLDGIESAFLYFGGATARGVLDNTSLAVKEILAGRDRVQTEAFEAFRGAYPFRAEFCAPAKGWEKGSVEGGVKYARNLVFRPRLAVKSWAALNAAILTELEADLPLRHLDDGRSAQEALALERQHLRALPEHLPATCRVVARVADKFGHVRVDHVTYSVPIRHAYRPAWVKLYHDRVAIAVGAEVVAQHVRVAPPLCLASGFSSLGVGPLDFSLHIEATGSHVPHKGLVQGHATFMPGAAQPSCRLPLDLSRVNDSPRFRHRPYAFDTLPVVHTLRLPAPYLTRSSRAVSVTLTTSALDRGSARRFEASPCRAAPRGLPSSLVQHGCS